MESVRIRRGQSGHGVVPVPATPASPLFPGCTYSSLLSGPHTSPVLHICPGPNTTPDCVALRCTLLTARYGGYGGYGDLRQSINIIDQSRM